MEGVKTALFLGDYLLTSTMNGVRDQASLVKQKREVGQDRNFNKN